MLFRIPLIAFTVALSAAFVRSAPGEDAATIIADCCSNAIALIHTTLDSAISLALESPDNAAQYIPVC
jgi:hypothetical protein